MESISICVRNSVGKIVMECVIETKGSTILQFIDGLCGDLRVVFEEGTWATWLYDLMKPHATVWRTHEGHRKVHACRDPTPFSTRINRRCVKPLSPTRKLCVPRRAPHFSTTPPHLFPLMPLQRPSSSRFFGSSQLWPWTCEGPCSAAQSQRTLILALSPIEFA